MRQLVCGGEVSSGKKGSRKVNNENAPDQRRAHNLLRVGPRDHERGPGRLNAPMAHIRSRLLPERVNGRHG